MLDDEGDAGRAWSETGVAWGYRPEFEAGWWELSPADVEIIEFACGVDATGRETLADWWGQATAANVISLPAPVPTDLKEAA